MKKKLKLRSGFTLIEFIAAFGIMAFIIVMFNNYITNSYRTMHYVDESNQSVENAKNIINIMNQEIKEANRAKNGSYAINVAAGQEIIFYSDFDHDNEIEKIRYYLEGSFLKKDTTEAGALPYYSGSAATVILSEYIESSSVIFTYYDENNNIIINPSANINQIKLVHIYLEIGRAPINYVIETNVQIRNLKNNY
ncbi:MAG: hypothetical protein ABIC82_04540 [bacterium]